MFKPLMADGHIPAFRQTDELLSALNTVVVVEAHGEFLQLASCSRSQPITVQA